MVDAQVAHLMVIGNSLKDVCNVAKSLSTGSWSTGVVSALSFNEDLCQIVITQTVFL